MFFVCSFQNQSVILKYIYNQLVLNLKKTLPYSQTQQELHPSLFSLTRLDMQLLCSKACFILPYNLLLNSLSSPFSLHFLSTFCSLCFLLCIGNFHDKSQIASCIFFIFKLLLPMSSLNRSFFVSSFCFSDVHCTLPHCVISYLHLVVSSHMWAERELSWEQARFGQCKVREGGCSSWRFARAQLPDTDWS